MGRGEVMGPGKPGCVQQLCEPKQVPANPIIYFLQDWSCLLFSIKNIIVDLKEKCFDFVFVLTFILCFY